MNERRIKRFFHGLRYTMLHPQWLVFRTDTDTRQWLGRQASGRVLDVGCADGAMRQHVSSTCEYVGLDYPDTAIDWYGTRPQVFGDAGCLSFARDSFNTVLLLDVLEHLTDPAAAILEARRVLVPGGTLVVKVPLIYPLHDVPRDFRRWTPFGLRQDLERLGFTVDAIQSLGMPMETAMLLANLAHAKCLLNAAASRSALGILYGLTLPVAVPFRNLVGWISAKTSCDKQLMPFGVCAVARKV